jgi:signal transduction histidine kinase
LSGEGKYEKITIMEFDKLQYNTGYQAGENVVKSHYPGEFPDRVIENAGLVPFRLIFGELPGDTTYSDVGSGITELLGVAPADFTEQVFDCMIEKIFPLSGDYPAGMSEVNLKFRNRELESYNAEIQVITAGKERKWIRYSSLPLIDEETGKAAGASGILYDITGSKLYGEKIKEKEEEYDILKADLLRNISHEIRTPLNAIVGFSALLGEHIDIPARRKEYLDIITRNSDHLLEVINDIMEISKIDAKMVKVRKDKVNLNSVLLKVRDQFSAEASGKGVLLSFEPDCNTRNFDVCTDWYKLIEVLRNLVENALKFTSEGRVEFGYSVKEGKIEFYVSDTGAGIPFDQQGKIFGRFFQGNSTTSRSYGGTRMGLPIAKAYIELLGGEIWFISNPGEGSVFRFTIPYERAGVDDIRTRMAI